MRFGISAPSQPGRGDTRYVYGMVAGGREREEIGRGPHLEKFHDAGAGGENEHTLQGA